MFKGHIYVQPRQSGKTRRLVCQLKNDENSIMIVHNENAVYSLRDCPNNDRIFSVGGLIRKIDQWGVMYDITWIKTILIDGYLFYHNEQKDAINRILWIFSSVESVIVKTTSGILYNENIVKLVRFCNVNMIPLKYLNQTECDITMYNNLLTDPRFTIHQLHEGFREYLPQEQYKTEIRGELYNGKD
jgi:hypothetical protein